MPAPEEEVDCQMSDVHRPDPDMPLNFAEPEMLCMLRESLRRFVAREMPRELARTWDHQDLFPKDVYASLAEMGVTGLAVSEEYGGAGRNIVACMATIEELSRRSLAVAIPYIMSACYAGMNLEECGTAEQKAELLPRVTAEGMRFAYGWTEPDIGADLANVRTTAERRGDRLVIRGAKRFCTGAELADYIYALVRSDPDKPKYQNLSFVLIPTDAPGLSITKMGTMGARGAATTDVQLEDVEVPFSAVMGGEAGWNNGWSSLVGPGMDIEKLEVAAMALGLAAAAVEDAWQYSTERKQFGGPISGIQSVRHMLADAQTRLHACRLMLTQAAWLAENKFPCRVETSMAKLFICDTAKDIVLKCQSVMGAYGYVEESDMERYVRDVLLMPIIGGSSAIQLNNIAAALRLPKQ